MNRQSDISGRIRQWLVNGGTHWWKTGSRLRKKKKMKSPSPMRNSHDFISKGETEQKHHTESWKAALTRGSGFYPVAPCKIENQGTESAPQNQGEHPPVPRPPAGGGNSENTGTHQRGRTEIDPSTLLAKMSVNPQPRVLHIPVNDQDWLRKKARNLTGSRRLSSGLRYSRMCSTKTELPSDDWSWLTSWLTSPHRGWKPSIHRCLHPRTQNWNCSQKFLLVWFQYFLFLKTSRAETFISELVSHLTG